MDKKIQEMDENIILWVQEHIRSPKMTPVIRVLTHLGDFGLLWISISMALIVSRKTRKTGIMSLAAISLCFFINNMLLKNIIDRDRPYDVVDNLDILIGRQPDSSFPSGHAANSLASAIVLYNMLEKKSGVSILFAGTIIALSRVYVGVHYLSDVLVGIGVGIFSGLSVCKFAKK